MSKGLIRGRTTFSAWVTTERNSIRWELNYDLINPTPNCVDTHREICLFRDEITVKGIIVGKGLNLMRCGTQTCVGLLVISRFNTHTKKNVTKLLRLSWC